MAGDETKACRVSKKRVDKMTDCVAAIYYVVPLVDRSQWRAFFAELSRASKLERGRALSPRGATVKQRASCRGSLVRRTTPALGVPAVRRTRLTRQSVSRERHRVRASDLVSDCCATGESANSFLIDAARPRRACFRDDERPQGHQPRGGMGLHAGTSPRDPPILPRARFPPRRVARARFPRERNPTRIRRSALASAI